LFISFLTSEWRILNFAYLPGVKLANSLSSWGVGASYAAHSEAKIALPGAFQRSTLFHNDYHTPDFRNHMLIFPTNFVLTANLGYKPIIEFLRSALSMLHDLFNHLHILPLTSLGSVYRNAPISLFGTEANRAKHSV
jgi:hypothetical protein